VTAPRRFGLPTCVALVVANMVGAGVFTTSGFALGDLGAPSRVLAAWVVGGVLAVLGALSYGALAARLRESGGEYMFLSRTLHPSLGFVAGWISLWAGFTAPIATAALVLGAYVSGGSGGDARAWATLALGVATLSQMAAAFGAKVQNVLVALKVVALVALGCYGVGWVGLQGPPAAGDGSAVPAWSWPVFATTVFWVSMSYSGWNAAVYVAGEVRDPERTVPRSLVLGAVATMGLYLLLNTFFVFSAPVDQLAGQKDIAAVAARAAGGAALETAVRVVLCAALFTSLTSMLMAGPRVYARMADDGVFPSVFRMGSGAPRAAVALQGLLALAVVWWAGLEQLLGYVGFTLSASTVLAVVGLMVLRRREGRAAVPVPGWPWVPLIFIVASIALGVLMYINTKAEPLWALATVGSGLLVYGVLRRVAAPPP